MADHIEDRELENLLKYGKPEAGDAFVLDVMQGVRKTRRKRRLILWSFGLTGALFGLAGAMLLSDSITRLFTFDLSLPPAQTMQAVLFVVGAAAFYNWFMNDDWSLGS